MAKIKITGIKGMNDMLPEEAGIWEKFEDTARCVAASYGYRQIRTPVLVFTAHSRSHGALFPRRG